ncbi:flippase [Methylobacillus sp. Pita1]|uniref:flippase n=1 Tax=Methylobacillus sp. Pita1 TaxID=3382642 RepID=UPI0038B57B3A
MISPSRWIRYLPANLRATLEHRPNLQKIISNIGWLFGDRILRMGLGLFIGIWIARYLGPQQYGLLNYALSFVALFSAIASLGLNGIVVRDLVKEPDTANISLGSAFFLQVIGGFLALGLAVFAIGIFRPADSVIRLMVAVLGCIMVFKASEVVKYWFESQVQSKYVVWVENSVFLIFGIINVILILTQSQLMTFVWALFAEGAMVAIALISLYTWRGRSLLDWHFSIQRVRILIKDSWPLVLSGLAIMAYMRIDQIMIGQMLGDEAVGVYSVAVRVSEIWYFIPMAIAASTFPAIIESKNRGEMIYYQRLQRLYNLMVLLAFIVALPMTVFSKLLVVMLFGQAYEQAGNVLVIHIWASVFVFLGVASSKWFVMENMQKYLFYRSACGLLVNVLANFMLIPLYGVVGAAFGTLLSQIFSTYLFDIFNKKTRHKFWMKTSSLIPLNFIRKKANSYIDN